MRMVIWNIRYGAGSGATFNLPVPGAGYLRSNRQNLADITAFISATDADIVGLIEIDTGSIRSGVNQAEEIAEALGHYSIYQCKYGEASFPKRVPVLRNQSNAFLAAPRVHGERFHYFDTGIKRLIIELELDDVAIFLVHLSLKYRHRQYQLRRLHELIRESSKPVIVAGDFNTFWGDDEMYLFREAAGLTSANPDNLPSYPSHAPRRELDFVLYGKGITKTGFDIAQTTLSDHLPLVFDFEISKSE